MKVIAPIRGQDDQGSGAFGASRGSRKHNGVDIACLKGTMVISPVDGMVTKIGYPYDPRDANKGHLRYVEVTTVRGNRHRFFYVLPTDEVEVGVAVEAGDILGKTQGLTAIYPSITDHFHYEVIDPWGGFINPTAWIKSGKYEATSS